MKKCPQCAATRAAAAREHQFNMLMAEALMTTLEVIDMNIVVLDRERAMLNKAKVTLTTLLGRRAPTEHVQ